VDERGRPIRGRETLDRIRALAIPPAWTDVWICPAANGHLQAVGVDAAGRKQYLYHQAWRDLRDRQKFDEMLAFASSLPALRSTSRRLLSRRGLTKERVLAFSVLLLDEGLFRIGSEVYAEDNGSYGLTTLERRHVRLERRGRVVFDYVGKTGRDIVQSIDDRRLFAVAGRLKERPGRGRKFLVFEDGDRVVNLHATDINGFIKDHTDGDFTAKDFRTWHATVLAAASVASCPAESSESGRRRVINRAAAAVSDALGNTPAVSKASYIDPRIFDLYRSGVTIPRADAAAFLENGARDRGERAVRKLFG
jgi:DNA topoisomerase I